MNVFNGFLLCAHLDALFDRGLLSFTDEGTGLISSELEADTIERLRLDKELRLQWVAAEHHAFLIWHRQNLFRR